jgi:hypothetical protein
MPSKRRKRTIYIDPEIDKTIRVLAVEEDRYFGDVAEDAFRLYIEKKRKKRSLNDVIRLP